MAYHKKTEPNIGSQSLWRKDLRQEIEKRIKLLETTVLRKEAENRKYPEGKIRVIKHRDSFQYYLRKTPTDTSGTYISAKNISLAKELVQKDYNRKLMDTALIEKEAWENVLKKIPQNNIEKIYNLLPDGKKVLVTPILLPDEEYIKVWEAQTYVGNPYPFGNTSYFTAKGEQVRSKSEILIANTLRDYGIPYRYEYPIIIDGVTKYIDFYTLNVRTREEFIFEHFGMLDDKGYAIDNTDKFNRFIANGYLPGKNFIFTMETSRNPLNVQIVEKILREYLL